MRYYKNKPERRTEYGVLQQNFAPLNIGALFRKISQEVNGI
jgi:hypothetical protein